MARLTLSGTAVAVVLLLLLAAATALAATFEGQGRDDPRVEIRFEKRGGEIKRFKIEGAKFFCTDGYVFRDGTRVGKMQIRRSRDGVRRFAGQFRNSDGDQTSEIRGKFTSGQEVAGVLRLTAVFKDAACDTRRVEWEARRSPGKTAHVSRTQGGP